MPLTKSAGGSEPSATRIKADPEFASMLETALKGAKGDGVPRWVLSALLEATTDALNQKVNGERLRATTMDWNPRPDQVWKKGMRTADNKRLTAWKHFQAHFENVPYSERPFAHQLRAHPKTKVLYEALCVFVSRNKTKGMSPNSIGDLFPVTEAARGGMLAGVKKSKLPQSKR